MLIVTIPTSPRLSKTEFVGESYCISISESFLNSFLNRKGKKKKKSDRPAWPGPRPGRGRRPRAPPRPTWVLAYRPLAGMRPASSGCPPAQVLAGRFQAGCRPGCIPFFYFDLFSWAVRCCLLLIVRRARVSRPAGPGCGRPQAGDSAGRCLPPTAPF